MQYDSNLYELFAARATATPDAIAVVEDEHTSTTYAELDRQASRLADFLTARGIRPEQPVGVMLPRTSEMVAALLGILKSGAAYVPIDADDPPARRQSVIEGSGCGPVLTHGALIETMRAGSPDMQSFDSIEFVDTRDVDFSDPGHAPSPAEPGGSRLAYIMFTSGSTGEPKGVEIEHRGVVNLLTTMRNLFDFTSADCFLAVSTIGFDISVVELFLPLIAGGRILLRDRRSLLAPRELAGDIRRFGVTVVQTGPSVWSVLLSAVPDFPRIRVAISTAEAIGVELARKLVVLGDHAWNLYGPTETTIWCTGIRMNDETIEDREYPSVSVSIGHPLANTSVFIRGEDGSYVADGERGELCIGGAGLARGYRDNPALTREKFIAVGDQGERYYRTGDIVAWSTEGDLLYYGRNDDQMKIRGVRVAPGEVESSLLSHPAVSQAAVTWYPTPNDSRSIMAGVVPEPGASPTARQLHDWLTTRLPAPMIPSRFTFCEALPLSTSGKVDRSAVRELGADDVDTPPRNDRPLTPTERTVVGIWQRLLGVDAIDVNDHFFTIGGDSLAAVRMATLAEEAFGVRIPERVVFEAPTPERFARRLDSLEAKSLRRWFFSFLVAFARNPKKKLRHHIEKRVSMWKLNRKTRSRSPRLPDMKGTAPILTGQRAMIAGWRGKRRNPDSFLITLNESGQRRGLFWCQQGFRGLRDFARNMGPDQPIHAMRSCYLILDYEYEEEAEQIAAIYAGEMCDIQPEGSFILGGDCRGAALVRTIADHLHAMGRTVSLLIMMEQRIFRPYDYKVALIFGRESHLNPYIGPGAEPDRLFQKAYPAGYTVDLITGMHGDLMVSPGNEILAEIVGRLIDTTESHADQEPNLQLIGGEK